MQSLWQLVGRAIAYLWCVCRWVVRLRPQNYLHVDVYQINEYLYMYSKLLCISSSQFLFDLYIHDIKELESYLPVCRKWIRLRR